MDTPEWEYYARCSRLKTKRTKKRLQQKDRDKKLIQLAKELETIGRLRFKPEYEMLDQPYQRGWKRTFVLRSDLKNLENAPFFTELLEHINTVQISHRNDFKVKRRRFGKKIYVDNVQLLRNLSEEEFIYGKLTEKEKAYFEKSLDYHAYRKEFVTCYAFTQPWRFVAEITPNMIIQVRVVDTELIKREAEIDAYLDRKNLKTRMWKLRNGYYGYGSAWYSRPKAKYDNLFKTEPIQKLIG